MKTQLYLPKKINVGYRERGDTYTGKLAYVIYWDDKGKLRKETSWQGWRDNKIPNTEIENVPTEGFVLNKGVGGTRESWGWNTRNEYIRVYDPRGFEFEISVANLLFILQECTSTKGKGLEGEFVYSWEGKELVLLPVDSFEYRESTKFTSLQGKKVTRKDMTPGCAYTSKQGDELLYLGRFPYYTMEYSRKRGNYNYELQNKKTHVFIDTNFEEPEEYDEYSSKGKYMTFNGFTKLATKNTETPVENYADLLEDFNNSEVGCEPKRFKYTKTDIDLSEVDNWNNKCRFYVGNEVNAQRCRIEEKIEYGAYDYRTGHRAENKHLGYTISKDYNFHFDKDGILIREYSNNRTTLPKEYRGVISKEDLLALDFNTCEVELDGGRTVELDKY